MCPTLRRVAALSSTQAVRVISTRAPLDLLFCAFHRDTSIFNLKDATYLGFCYLNLAEGVCRTVEAKGPPCLCLSIKLHITNT